MSTRFPKPAEPAPDDRKPQGSESAYGARIDALFREAIRDLDALKRPHAGETAK